LNKKIKAMKLNWIVPLAIFLFSYTVEAQNLKKNELKILKSVEANYSASVKLLEETVRVNSGTQNLEGVKKVGMIYKKFLDDLGFETRWVDMPPSMKRGGHLIGEIKGKRGKRVLLIGHIDTVFEPSTNDTGWKFMDSIAMGPGSNDMKGGNMVLLAALKALKDNELLKDRSIMVILHGDEESAGRPIDVSRKDIIELAKRSDAALCFETGTGFGEATVARRGSSGWKLTVTGRQAHSAGVFGRNTGGGAIYEASRILHRFYTELQEEYLTYNPGMIVGGTEVLLDSSGTSASVSGKTNIVANTAVVSGDLRFISEEQKNRARDKMRKIVSESLPVTSAVIEFNDGYPSMPPTDGNMALLAELSKVSVDLGKNEVKPYNPGARGAGDISFIAQYTHCLDGLGPLGGRAHAPGEFVNLRTLLDIEKRAALLLYRLTNQEVVIDNKR
jgi:glutamate carboxypeptidase